MRDKVFIDSNILVYAVISKDEVEKATIGKQLLGQAPIVSPQVIFEWINVARKKFKFTTAECLEMVENWLPFCEIVEENNAVIQEAFKLLKCHSFQPFDAKIVATALIAGCSILYSEDMQHGKVIDERLTIINPFL